MAYKVTPKDKDSNTVVVSSGAKKAQMAMSWKWWLADTKEQLKRELLDTVSFLKEQQQFRYRQAGMYARLYGNMPMYNFVGTNMQKMTNGPNNLPLDRPTMNVIQSCVDTKVSRISQSRPRPIFLTDGGDYKQRNMAKKLNNFIVGELYQTKAYELGEFVLRDASVLGTGCLKVFRTSDKKVGVERRLLTELLVDPNDALYGDPRCLYELKLVDRDVMAQMFPKHRSDINKAEQGYPDNGQDSQKTASDQIIVAEAWHLPSGEGADDGRHAIVCTSGVILDEGWERQKFPFVFLHDSPRILGMWGQGTPERLMGTQIEINKLLMTISASINLVGVPRVFVEKGSKVVKSHLNNQIGAIVEYSGTKPQYEVAPCVPQEMYTQLQNLIQYAYQQEGISQLAASSVKPAGLNSGEAQRAYQDNQTDRLAALSKRYDNVFVDLSYLMMDEAIAIAQETGEYQTIYPGKNGTQRVDLPDVKSLVDNPFVIQCFDASSLPRDPAGRLQKVIEMMQAAIISPQEGRRLLDYPDIEQVDKLANASEERILQALDGIVEDGTYTAPDTFMDLALAKQLVTQYYNLYGSAKLEEEKMELLRDFDTQLDALTQAAMPQPQPGGMPQANPQAPPTSELLPNVPPTA